MTNQTRSPRLRALFFLLLASLVFAACSGLVQNANWPGVSTKGDTIYIAYGPSVVAFDVATREELWSYPPEPQAQRSFYAAPSVQDDRIIVGDYGVSGGFFSPGVNVSLIALEVSEGDAAPRELWVNDTAASDRIVAPPLQVGDIVYVGTADNTMLAFEASSGAELWRFETGHSIWAEPILIDDTLYVASLDKTIYALDPESGALKWELAFDGAIINRPAVDDGILYAGSFDNKLHAVDVAGQTEAWTVDATSWVWAGPAVSGGRVFFSDLDGTIYAVDATDGTLIWTIDGSALDVGSGSVLDIGLVQAVPVTDGDIVIFAGADEEGEAETLGGTLLAVSQADGAVVWSTRTPAPVYANPVLVGDRLAVVMSSPDGLLYLYELETGQQDGAPLMPVVPDQG